MFIDINTPFHDPTYSFRHLRHARALSISEIAVRVGLKKEYLDRIDAGYGRIMEEVYGTSEEVGGVLKHIEPAAFFDRFFPVQVELPQPPVPPQVKQYFKR